MLYTIPDYYKEFQCIADQCEDTCCAGWQIVIDDKALAKYKKIHGKFGWRMLRSVNWREGTFCQDKEKRCAFLNDRNLCDLYINQGEKSLCKTCRLYPRHIEEFEGLREITLSISCPEVARILMERETPVTFLTYEKDGEEEYEDFDPFFFSILEDARAEMIRILQNRELPVEQRVVLVLGMAHDMQGRINRQEMFSCMDVIEKYKSEAAETFVRDFLMKSVSAGDGSADDVTISGKVNICNEAALLSEAMFGKLYDLEMLKETWYVLLKETEKILYGRGVTGYTKLAREFADWKRERPEMDIHLEQLLVYFLFTYFPGAVYDGEVYAKVQMAVFCTWMIHELWMARWTQNEKSLDMDEVIDLVYRFSREVEHSDENLKRVDEMMRKKWML